MLPGLTDPEIRRLRMSLGYGTHRKGRPLSPIEVGMLLERALDSGASLQDCANCVHLRGPTQLTRFLNVLELPEDLRHLISWGRSSDSIGFTTAVQIARLPDADDQRVIARAVLEERLQTGEVRQVAQIQSRTGRAVQDCLRQVLGMRPTVERRYVFIGAVVDEEVEAELAKMTQPERDRLLFSGLESVGIQGASGRLGDKLFTLIGDKELEAALTSYGKAALEERLRLHINRKVSNVLYND